MSSDGELVCVHGERQTGRVINGLRREGCSWCTCSSHPWGLLRLGVYSGTSTCKASGLKELLGEWGALAAGNCPEKNK